MEPQKLKKALKNLQQNSSETVTNENNKETPKEIPEERCISPEEKQKNIDNLTFNIIVKSWNIKQIIKLLGNTPNQPTKFRTKNWAEINDDALQTYNTNNQIKFKI